MSQRGVRLQVESLEERSVPSSVNLPAPFIGPLIAQTSTLPAIVSSTAGTTPTTPTTGTTPPVTTPVTTPVLTPVAGTPITQADSNHLLRESIPILKSLNRTLAVANHDYGGHLYNAVEMIFHAERQLRAGLVFQNGGPLYIAVPPPDHTPSPNIEPQRVSDAQLSGTIPVLESTLSILQQANKVYGGHLASAIWYINTAISEIQSALAFSATNNY